MEYKVKYKWIKQEIKEKIERHELKEGQVIPSESELCARYQVSRITVRKAIDELVRDGLVYRIKGKGTFVQNLEKKGLSNIYSFTEAILHRGKTPSKRLLSMEKTEADSALKERMGLECGQVYRIKSLYFADGQPYCVNTSVLPADLFPNLEFFDFNNRSLYEVLKSFYDLSFTRVNQVIHAVAADEETGTLLEMQVGRPLLNIDAASYCLKDGEERIFEIYECYIVTDIMNYCVEKYNG